MRGFVLGLFLMLSFSGCLSEDPEPETETSPALADVRVDDLRVHMDIPVPVVLIGFDEGYADTLRASLLDETVDHYVYDFPRNFLLDSAGGGSQVPNAMLPTANYSVHDLSALKQDLLAAMEEHRGPGGVNATAIEDWLAAALPANGVSLSKQTPALVFLHLGGANQYRVVYSTGHVDDARVFGERQGLLIMDASAAADPWVGAFNSWEEPLSSSPVSVPVLHQAILHATHYRLLQGPLYPVSLQECHAITLIVASRATTLTETIPEYQSALALADAPKLTKQWEALLGEGNVHVDLEGRLLPVDDPVLDAILRTGDLDALRWHFDENWDDYWVAHEGCEAYVSLYLVGDLADSGISGIAMYDADNDRRFSLSSFNDLDRMRGDEGGTVFGSQYQGDESIYTFDWVNFLFSHETGHLFGQRHPHDVSAEDAPGFGFTWSSGWTAMSYQVGSKNPEFGSTDHNNHWRNKAAAAIAAATAQGLEETDAYQDALWHMAQYQWVEAAESLLPML